MKKKSVLCSTILLRELYEKLKHTLYEQPRALLTLILHTPSVGLLPPHLILSFSPLIVYTFLCIWEQMVFTVYCAVRAECLNTVEANLSSQRVKAGRIYTSTTVLWRYNVNSNTSRIFSVWCTSASAVRFTFLACLCTTHHVNEITYKKRLPLIWSFELAANFTHEMGAVQFVTVNQINIPACIADIKCTLVWEGSWCLIVTVRGLCHSPMPTQVPIIPFIDALMASKLKPTGLN
jgi:hypothetical protein